MSVSKFTFYLKYYWFFFQEWLLKVDYLILLHFVTDYMEEHTCSFSEAVKRLSLCEEDAQLCARIITLQTTTLVTVVDTYLRQQYDEEVYYCLF